MKPAVLFVVAVLFAAAAARAEQPPPGTEAEKAQLIASLLQRSGPGKVPGAAPPSGLCGELLSLLAAGSPDVQFLEPVVRTVDFHHPEVRHLRRCGSWEDATEYPFRVYRFSADGGTASPVEQYVYQQWGGYDSRDAGGSCKLRDAVPVTRAADNYNAVIRFRGTVFIFDLDVSASRPGYEFSLWGFDTKRRAFDEACTARERPPSKSPRRPPAFWPHIY